MKQKQVFKPAISQLWGAILSSPAIGHWRQSNMQFRSIQAETINILCLALICINFLLSYTNFWGVYHLSGIVSLFALIVLLLSKWEYFTISRFLFILQLYSGLILLGTEILESFQLGFLYCAVLALLFVLFSKEENWQLLISCLLLIGLAFSLNLTDLPFYLPFLPGENLIQEAFILNTGCILFSIVLAICYVFSIYERSENNLKLYVEELKAKEIEIKLQNAELLTLNAHLVSSKEELVKSHIFLNTIIDNLPVTLFVKQARDLKFIRMNKSGQQLTCLSEKEVINKTSEDIFPAEQARDFTASDKKALADKTVIKREELLTGKDGQTHVVYTRKLPIYDKNGSALYIIGISEDITHRKKTEEVLRKTVEELQKRNNELDNYVYRVSHDLRSPLCSMSGLINLAKMETNVDVIKNYIGMIENSISKSDRFIQSILHHSKILNTPPQAQLIAFEEMIYECMEDYMEADDKIQINVNSTATSKFYSDEFRVNLIIRNIISNAIKFFNPDLQERYVTFDIAIDEHKAEIAVYDNGIGIEQEHIARVYDMFFRGTSRSNGSGLGLYITKQAIETLEGDIDVTSKWGEGTCFHISLPNKIKENEV